MQGRSRRPGRHARRPGPRGRKPGPPGPGKPVPVTNPEPEKAAASAGLHYVTDTRPGIRRRMGKLGFEYLDTRGRRITNQAQLKRIASLAVIPGS